MEASLPPVLAERARSECARSMRAVGGRPASQKVPGNLLLLKCNGSMTRAVEVSSGIPNELEVGTKEKRGDEPVNGKRR